MTVRPGSAGPNSWRRVKQRTDDTRDRNKKTLDAAAEMRGSELLAIQADVTVARPTGPYSSVDR